MKSKLIVILFILCKGVLAQDFKSEYRNSTKVWLGIDYTAAKFISSADFPKPFEIMSLMREWNNFVITEASKYDLYTAFQTSKISIDLNQVTNRNAEIDPSKSISDSDYNLDESQAKAIALSYDFSEIDGVALLLVAESYNKRKVEGSYWLVVVQAKTKEVLFTKRYVAAPRGFGLKNYWARTFYNTLDFIEKDIDDRLR